MSARLGRPVASPQAAPGPRPSPLERYLVHPGPGTARLLQHLAQALAHFGAAAGPGLAAAGLAVVSGVAMWRRAQARRMAEGARLVRVLAPPEVDPEGAATLWSNLVALLRPAWRRALVGQPHIGFELTASAGMLGVAFWVPGQVPPGLVERAIEAAWPGALTETVPAAPPIVAPALATGGELRLAVAEQYPLRTDYKVDPLRPLLGALAGLEEGQYACVQILARPTTGRRLARLQRAAVSRRNGRPTGVLTQLVDLAGPGPSTRPATADPSRAPDVAAILAKAAQPCWAVCVRYAVASAEPDAHAAASLRGHAHAVASAFALFAGRNRLERRRLARPVATLAARRLRRGDLVSVAELAAVAHLPADVAIPGLPRAGAKAVAPPPLRWRPWPARVRQLAPPWGSRVRAPPSCSAMRRRAAADRWP